MGYDKDNVFAKIINKELPAEIIVESIHAMAFNDIAPRAPIHVLIIPKKEYINYHDFTSNASHEEIIDIYKLINSIIDKFGLKRKGYRIITDTGNDGNQEVKHLHFHLLAGKNLGIMIN